MSTSVISILSLMSKWFFIPNLCSLYFFAFQLRLCRKRLTWSNGYLEVIFSYPRRIFYYICYCLCRCQKSVLAWAPYCLLRLYTCITGGANICQTTIKTHWIKVICLLSNEQLILNWVQLIHYCFDMKSHSTPIKRNDIDNQLFIFNWPAVIMLIVNTFRCVRSNLRSTSQHLCNFSDWTLFNGVLWM